MEDLKNISKVSLQSYEVNGIGIMHIYFQHFVLFNISFYFFKNSLSFSTIVTFAPLEFASKPNDPEPPNRSNAFKSLRSFPNQLNKVSLFFLSRSYFFGAIKCNLFPRMSPEIIFIFPIVS